MRRASILFLSFFLVTFAWAAVAAGAAWFGSFQTLAVPISKEGFLSRLGDDVAIIDFAGATPILISDQENFAQQLYKAGAIFVIPARKKTCVDLRKFPI